MKEAILYIEQNIIDHLMENPLFFMYKDNNQWVSNSPLLNIQMDDYAYGCDSFLFIIDNIDNVEHINNHFTTNITFHPIDTTDADINILVKHTLDRANNTGDKYWMKELLWFLKWINVNYTVFENAVAQFSEQNAQRFYSKLSNIVQCLSVNTQNNIAKICEKHQIRCAVKYPTMLKEACKSLNIDTNDIENKDLFSLIDEICNVILWDDDCFDINEVPHEISISESCDNIWINLLRWITLDTPLKDYNNLLKIIPLVNESMRLLIFKRYFHDIRQNNTILDIELLQQFVNSDYERYITFRNCLLNPCVHNDLTIKLLADCILTIQRNNFTALQSFNGCLDLFIKHSDIINPNMSFDISQILPQCKDGAVLNNNFAGLIEYYVVCKIDDSKFSKEHLRKTVEDIMQQRCYAKSTTSKDGKSKWTFALTNYNIEQVNSFLRYKIEPIDESKRNIIEEKTIPDSANYVSNLEGTIRKKVDSENGIFKIPSSNFSSSNFYTWLLWQYSNPMYVVVKPRTDVVCGIEYDVLGIGKKILKENPQISEENLKQLFDIEESKKIFELTVAQLDNEPNLIKNESTYKFNYDRNRLLHLSQKYHNHRSKNCYLFRDFSISSERFTPFCAPEISNRCSDILKLPFAWCRGNRCFCNNLNMSTLNKSSDWKDYNLLLISEIAGYPMLVKKGTLYGAKDVVRQFIGMVNKAFRKFKQLRCRDCGHLLFAVENRAQFDSHNYFSCHNPNCRQYKQSVYINFCYHCKSGLIDSRDAKKCPNGRFICPKCLSCCDDQQYERQARRYEIEHRTIPVWLQNRIGNGHNNKNQFYCAKCGTLLNSENNRWFCPDCGFQYDRQFDLYYHPYNDILTNRHERNERFKITSDE